MDEMPRKTAAELEAECLRLLARDSHTRDIKSVEPPFQSADRAGPVAKQAKVETTFSYNPTPGRSIKKTAPSAGEC